MAIRHLQLTSPEARVTEPVIYQMIKQFDVVPSIRRANIANHQGWMVIELAGEEAQIDNAIEYARSIGVEVSDATGDIVAGAACGAVGMLLSVIAMVDPSRGAEFAMKLAARRLLAPTMLLTTTFGLPGRCSARNCAMRRPDESVPPPEPAPTIMVMVLPAKLGGWAHAGVANVSTAMRGAPHAILSLRGTGRRASTFASFRMAAIPPSLALAVLMFEVAAYFHRLDDARRCRIRAVDGRRAQRA